MAVFSLLVSPAPLHDSNKKDKNERLCPHIKAGCV
jgi:hypothetical protein